MIYKVAYDSWLYYKCTEKYLSIILLEFSISIKFKKLHKNSSPYTAFDLRLNRKLLYIKRGNLKGEPR